MSAKTLKRLERAAMRWYHWMDRKDYLFGNPFIRVSELGDACAAHAQRKGAKRKGRDK